MWEKVGIVRNHKQLTQAFIKITEWENEIGEIEEISQELAELKNMFLVGKIIIKDALQRKRTLGAHYILSK